MTEDSKTDKDIFLQRAKDTLDKVAVERADYKGSCEDCKYSKSNFPRDLRCTHPIVVAAALSVDQGYNRERFQDANTQRSSRSNAVHGGPVLCGPNGFLYEPEELSEDLIGVITDNPVVRFFKWLFDLKH